MPTPSAEQHDNIMRLLHVFDQSESVFAEHQTKDFKKYALNLTQTIKVC